MQRGPEGTWRDYVGPYFKSLPLRLLSASRSPAQDSKAQSKSQRLSMFNAHKVAKSVPKLLRPSTPRNFLENMLAGKIAQGALSHPKRITDNSESFSHMVQERTTTNCKGIQMRKRLWFLVPRTPSSGQGPDEERSLCVGQNN